MQDRNMRNVGLEDEGCKIAEETHPYSTAGSSLITLARHPSFCEEH